MKGNVLNSQNFVLSTTPTSFGDGGDDDDDDPRSDTLLSPTPKMRRNVFVLFDRFIRACLATSISMNSSNAHHAASTITTNEISSPIAVVSLLVLEFQFAKN